MTYERQAPIEEIDIAKFDWPIRAEQEAFGAASVRPHDGAGR